MKNNKLTENDLIVPVLELMKSHNGFISIRDIRNHILNHYPLTDADMKMSKTRKNEHMFEQQIRNLTSHKKLEHLGLAENVENGFRLLPQIDQLLNKSSEWVYDVINSGRPHKAIKKIFSGVNKNDAIIGFDENVVEGTMVTTKNTEKRMRSSRLRAAAIQHFTNNGIIRCDCCGFEFLPFYGAKYGASCIEFHHKKPIFMYTGQDETKTIKQALDNLLPVCPNCHRVIHKNYLFSDSAINHLKREIAAARAASL